MASRGPSLAALAVVALFAVAAAPSHPPDRVTVGSVPWAALTAESLGRVERDLWLSRIVLVLSPRDPAGLALTLADLQDPGSPRYHRWLSPEEFGFRFGAAAGDVEDLGVWLSGQGLHVESLPGGRTAIVFSGYASDVERAFATRLERFDHAGGSRIANVEPPSVPARFGRVVAGVLSLHGFEKRHPVAALQVTEGSSHSLGPADFATIYGTGPLQGAGVDGRGQRVAVLSRSNVNLEDARRFRARFGLPANDPQVVLNGPDPGILGGVDRVEANIDAQWSGGVAPGVQVLVVVSKTTDTTDGIDLSALYAVDRNVADVVSLSYGDCEADLTPADQAFYSNVWAQAAAQGISVIVASGDSGAAGCQASNLPQGLALAVNGLGSSPYATNVGGTQFDDGPDPTAYWSPASDPVTQRSARSYIPEAAWNESRTNGGLGLLATGGGFSRVFSRPYWQEVPGLAAGEWRAVPDLSVNASGRVPYLFFDSGGLQNRYAGTSFSAPSMAGVAALLLQRAGGRHGNLNPRLYELGRAQYAAGGLAAFHDVFKGSNTVPGVTGYDAGPGYDLATGLGSPDATALSEGWGSRPTGDADFLLTATPGVLAVDSGGAGTVEVLVEGVGGAVTATLAAEGLPEGVTAAFTPSTAGGAGKTGIVSGGVPATLVLAAAAGTPGMTTSVSVAATAGSVTRRIVIALALGGASATGTPGVELQVPVVLDAYGAAGSHFTSDLVAVNRSSADVTLQLRYVAAPGTGGSGPVVARSLPAFRQLFVKDVVASLAANGYSFDSGRAAKLGTLFANFAGVADPGVVFAGSRVTTPNPDAEVGGAFGTFFAATPCGSATSGETWIYGLRDTASLRSNLAVVHSPSGQSSLAAAGPVGVSIQLFDGDTGQAAGAPIAVTLAAGEFRQWSGILGDTGVSNGYARVRRTAGTDRFIAYGVMNDGGSAGGGTSDGSYVASGGAEGLVPIVLDIPGSSPFQSSLVLVNPSLTLPASVSLRYTPASQFPSAGGGGTVSLSLAPGQQLVREDALAALRDLGLAIPSQGSQGGTLEVSGAYALARTISPNRNPSVGGAFGVSYPAVSRARQATREAWVYGLRQDQEVRSNLAIADARTGDPRAVDYAVELYDGDHGGAPVRTFTATLRGGDWTQISLILAQAGLRSGYVRVLAAQPSSFAVYGVVNDGSRPGMRTSDGSYLPMVTSP